MLRRIAAIAIVLERRTLFCTRVRLQDMSSESEVSNEEKAWIVCFLYLLAIIVRRSAEVLLDGTETTQPQPRPRIRMGLTRARAPEPTVDRDGRARRRQLSRKSTGACTRARSRPRSAFEHRVIPPPTGLDPWNGSNLCPLLEFGSQIRAPCPGIRSGFLTFRVRKGPAAQTSRPRPRRPSRGCWRL